MCKLKRKKAVGINSLPNEAWIFENEQAEKEFSKILKIWELKEMLED